MRNEHITIIGGGNLGAAMAEGFAQSGLVRPDQITVTRRRPEKLAHLQAQGIAVLADNVAAVRRATLVILAVKPIQLDDVLHEIRPALQPAQLVASTVTGVSLQDLADRLGDAQPLVRVMPNTAIAIRESMTCVATRQATADQLALVLNLFGTVGQAIRIEEELMGAATVLGACGVAYALRFIRAASQGGIEIGFGSDTAQLIAAQTVKGAASLLLTNGQHPEREIDKVTTPQGCTIAGLNEMEHRGFSSALIRGIVASFRKVAHMAETYRKA